MSALDLTVITATTPERSALFGEALKSLHAQTLKPKYRFMRDDEHRGPARTLNQLANGVDTEWLFRLDDDDLLDPDHFEVLSHWLETGADIVYTYCRVDGTDDPERYQIRWQTSENGWGELYERNWIPCSAAISTELFHDLGGYDPDADEEDWDFWQRALDVDATFLCVPCATWTYRMNPEWQHRSDR